MLSSFMYSIYYCHHYYLAVAHNAFYLLYFHMNRNNNCVCLKVMSTTSRCVCGYWTHTPSTPQYVLSNLQVQ